MSKILSAFLIVGFFSSLNGNSPFPARGFAKILTDQEALTRLESYRSFVSRDLNQSGFHTAYAFQFRLRHMPQRGAETYQTGTIYGLSLGHGLTRVDIASEKNLLFQTGIKPKAWVFTTDSNGSRLMDDRSLFEPMIDGMNHTPFDILMPFAFWDGFYLKSGKVAGRPAHLFSFSPPEWVKVARPDFIEIVMALDKSYEAPLRVESYSRLNVPYRTYILNSLKKVGDQWIIKSIDCKDRLNRSTTRFEVTSAALNLDLDFSLFSAPGLMLRPSVPRESFISTK